jgi:hypothetical protein
MRGVKNMNSPNFDTQSSIVEEPRLGHQVNGEGKMSTMIGIKQAANWIHDSLGKITPGVMVRGVTLGVLLTIGTGVYLGMDSGTTSEATITASKKVDTEYRFMDLEDEPLSVEFLRTYVYPEEAAQVKAPAKSVDTEYRFMDVEDELSVEDLLTYVYPEEAAQVKAPAKSVHTEYQFMDLEDEPLSVEFLRTYVYPEERPSRSEAPSPHKQEIERLEGEMSAILAEAREDPSMDTLELDRDLRRLHHQIDLLRLAAMEQQ